MKTNTKITTKPIILLIFISFILFPTIAFASWWNPFSWNVWSNIFHKANTETQVLENCVKELEKKLGDIATSSKELNIESTSTAVKKTTIDETKKVSPVVAVPKPSTPFTTSNDNLSSSTSPSIETWAELEAKYFISADQKGWTSQIITNALGEKRYYRKEGSQWVRKNSEAETLQSYVAPPTSEQLANVRHVCLWNTEIKAICDKAEFMPGYYNNIIFRSQIDIMFSNFLVAMSDQQKQRIVAEKSIMDCLMAPSPEEERLLDPDTKMYLLQLRCGTVTVADRTNYELSRIKSSVDELKYRLDSKISFPSLFLDQIKTPTLDTTKWQVRWDGSGGTVTNSAGGSYQFHCEDNTCRSY